MTSGTDELAEIEDKIKRTKLSKEAREKARHELKKLRQMSPMSAEATVVRNYLDWLLSIPWNKKRKAQKDLAVVDYLGVPKLRSLGTPEDGDFRSSAADRRSHRSVRLAIAR